MKLLRVSQPSISNGGVMLVSWWSGDVRLILWNQELGGLIYSMPDSKIYIKRYAYMYSRGILFYQVLSVGYLCAGYLGYFLGFDISL